MPSTAPQLFPPSRLRRPDLVPNPQSMPRSRPKSRTGPTARSSTSLRRSSVASRTVNGRAGRARRRMAHSPGQTARRPWPRTHAVRPADRAQGGLVSPQPGVIRHKPAIRAVSGCSRLTVCATTASRSRCLGARGGVPPGSVAERSQRDTPTVLPFAFTRRPGIRTGQPPQMSSTSLPAD